MDKPRVAVLMSTYNGEKYIKEQIDSILLQKGVDVKLYIRDDGSVDNTCNIINEYDDNRIVLISDGRNLGAGVSFFTLLKYVVDIDKAIEFFAFSDQDDIWLDNKLLSGVNCIIGSDSPLLYGSDVMVYRDGVNYGMCRGGQVYQDKALDIVLDAVKCAACTMVLNRRLAEIICSTKLPGADILNIRFHDTWSYLMALAYGKIVCDSNSYILHRIHGNNLWGMGESLIKKAFKACCFVAKSFLRFVAGRRRKGALKEYFARIGVGFQRRTAMYFLDSVVDYNGEDVEFIRMIAHYRDSFKNKLNLLKHSAECHRENESRVFFWVKVMLNLV